MELRPPDPPLADGRILLRPHEERDVPALVEACRDEASQRWTTVPFPYEEENARAWIAESAGRWEDGSAATFSIVDARTDGLLGTIALRDAGWPVGELGYLVAPWARGRGVASGALRLLARWAFGELGLVRLQLVTDVDNVASQRAAEKAGFRREGVLRQALELKGRRSDCVMWSRLPADAEP